MKTHGIMFHHFHDESKHIVEQGSISALTFEKIIKYYQNEYNLLDAEAFLYRMRRGSLEPNDTCLTFDDALLCQYDIAFEVLNKLNLTGFFFVYTSPFEGEVEKLEVYRHFRSLMFKDIDDFYTSFWKIVKINEKRIGIDFSKIQEKFNPDTFLTNSPFYSNNDKFFRYLRDYILKDYYFELMDEMMDSYNYDVNEWKKKLWINEAQLKDLSNKGNVVGLHSHTHSTIMNQLSYEEQLFEYSRNKQILEDILDKQIDTVSYPCGKYNEDTPKVLRELGIRYGFDAFYNVELDNLHIPREDHANILKKMKALGEI